MAVESTRTLRAGPAAVNVDPLDGGRITSLAVDGVELLGGVGTGVIEHGSFVMVPWAGRIRDGVLRVDGVEHHLPTDRTHPHAGHGLVMDRPWDVVAEAGSSLSIRCDLDSRWPFPGHVVQEFRLSADRLEQRIEVHASDGAAFPATVGLASVVPQGAGFRVDSGAGLHGPGHAGPRCCRYPQRRGGAGSPGTVG